MTAMMEALSFLGPRGLVARYANSCVYCHSKQCCWCVLGPGSTRHACSALADAWRPALVTAQHVYHTRNLGNDCADHAALATLCSVSNHDLDCNSVFVTTFFSHDFDASTCFSSCNNIGEVFEKLRGREGREVGGKISHFVLSFFLLKSHSLCSLWASCREISVVFLLLFCGYQQIL